VALVHFFPTSPPPTSVRDPVTGDQPGARDWGKQEEAKCDEDDDLWSAQTLTGGDGDELDEDEVCEKQFVYVFCEKQFVYVMSVCHDDDRADLIRCARSSLSMCFARRPERVDARTTTMRGASRRASSSCPRLCPCRCREGGRGGGGGGGGGARPRADGQARVAKVGGWGVIICSYLLGFGVCAGGCMCSMIRVANFSFEASESNYYWHWLGLVFDWS
jgi:hypothetical protein